MLIAAIYLAVVRFVDLNEKEPLWAVGTQVFVGDGGEEVVIWTDDALFCVVDTLKGYAADFFNKLPY